MFFLLFILLRVHLWIESFEPYPLYTCLVFVFIASHFSLYPRLEKTKVDRLPPRLSPFHGLIDTTPYRVAGHLLFSRDFLFLLLPDETVGVTEAIGWFWGGQSVSTPGASMLKIS